MILKEYFLSCHSAIIGNIKRWNRVFFLNYYMMIIDPYGWTQVVLDPSICGLVSLPINSKWKSVLLPITIFVSFVYKY